MVGGETGEITFRRIKYELRTSSKKKSIFLYNILEDWESADFKVVVQFMSVFVTHRDWAYSYLRIVTVSPL